MNKKTREIVEGILFLPAMVLLAAVVFVGFYLIIRMGNEVVYAWYALLQRMLHLPHAVALALTVLLTPATVYGLFYAIGRLRRKPKLRA